jgi:hypothetical protein
MSTVNGKSAAQGAICAALSVVVTTVAIAIATLSFHPWLASVVPSGSIATVPADVTRA